MMKMRKDNHISYEQNHFFDKYLFRPQDFVRIFLKRWLFTRLLKLRDKQSCKYCGRDQKIVWSVKDEVWNRLPKRYRNKALCLECFVELYPGKLSTDDFESISYVDPFKEYNTYITPNPRPKPKERIKRRVESLQQLIDSDEFEDAKDGLRVFVEKENATFVLVDGEWENEKNI